MKIGSTTGAPGDSVRVAVSITNKVSVGLLYMRMSYDTSSPGCPCFIEFGGFTPGTRQAGWKVFDSDSDTSHAEIHITGIADSLFPMQPDTTPVGYLNFKITPQEVPPNVVVPICFKFRTSTDNTMYDSTGNYWIDTSMIDYVCGNITILPTGVEDSKGGRPLGFELGQNYPNPFNSSTAFNLYLPKAGRYAVRIYNLAGQEIKSFVEEASAGIKTFRWDGTDRNSVPVSSGIYLYKAEVGDFVATKKMMLIK